ncbi:unnamed protein product [Malus baccata var. baccata]
MVHAAREVFNPFLPDVHIFTDHRDGQQAGESSGYGISLVAETTSGCYISADTTISYAQGGQIDELDYEKKYFCLFHLCALCPQDVQKFGTPCTSTSTVILKCAGCGLNNLCRKIS